MDTNLRNLIDLLKEQEKLQSQQSEIAKQLRTLKQKLRDHINAADSHKKNG